MDIVIRNLTKEFLSREVNQFIAILHDIPGEYWEQENFLLDLEGKFEYSCYALVNQKLVGYIIASERANAIAHIHKFMVASGYRGMKIGCRMLAFLETTLTEKEIKRITLKVERSNDRGINFYLNHEFVFISENPEHHEVPNLLVMSKTL